MPRKYRHIQEYEKEIMDLRRQGFSNREVCEKLGFELKQLKNFINRNNKKQKKIAAGIALKRKGRPPKKYDISEMDKVSELKYILARKEAKIKSLEINAGFSLAYRKEVRPSVKYMVIYRHKDKYSINSMCKFFDVSRSGYYDYVK